MARVRKPAVTQYERRRWLDDLESGKGITAIANAARRDIRIVKRHIAIAREDRQIASVKREFLLNRLEQHQVDLLNEAQRLKKLVPRYLDATLIPEDTMQKKIHEALIEHTTYAKLKGLIETYFYSVQKYQPAIEKAYGELHKEEVQCKKTLPARIKTYDWTPSLMESAKDNLPMDETSGIRYVPEKLNDGMYDIRWGPERLNSSPISEEDITVVVDTHKKLRNIAAGYQSDFNKYRERIKKASEPIIEELDIMIMKRVVPGHCKYCPV